MDAALALNIPVIEQRIGGRDEWHSSTIGITPPQDLGYSGDRTSVVSNREQKVESSSLAIEGRTRIAVGVVTEQAVKPAEDRLRRKKPHSPAFSEYQFNRKTAELISLLNDLKPNLQQIEGAGIMIAFRRSLEEIWLVAGRLPREKIVVVSAVEEAVRNTKWRELSVGQVEVLQRILSNVITPEEISHQDVSRAFRAINRSRIDIFPSALDEEDEDDEAATDADR